MNAGTARQGPLPLRKAAAGEGAMTGRPDTRTGTARAPAGEPGPPRPQTAAAFAHAAGAFARRPGIAAVLVAVFALHVYQTHHKSLPVGDAIPSRYLPLSLLTEGDFDLDEFRELRAGGIPYYLTRQGRHLYSKYPVGAALLATPVYAAARLIGYDLGEKGLRRVEKLSASLMVSLSVAFLLLALMEQAPFGVALALSLAYAFGTSSWSVSSMALWQHPASQMLGALTLYLLASGARRPRRIAWAGLACAASVACRPTNVVPAAAVTAFVLHRCPRQLPWFLLAALPVAAGLAAYNLSAFGNLSGGYLGCVNWYREDMPARQFLANLAGLLASPNRGLLIYSPFLVLGVAGTARAWAQRRFDLFFYTSLVAPGYWVLMARWHQWYGGHTFGPRMLSDPLPYLVFLALPVAGEVLARPWRTWAAAALVGFSVAVHGLGFLVGDGQWNLAPVNVDERPQRVWDWGDTQLSRAAEVVWRRWTR